MPAVSVLIVSWNARDALERCLSSLDFAACEVVVVDNASQDGSAELVASRFPHAVLDRQPANLGFSGGVNRAFALASGDLLLLLNSDAAATAGSIDRIAAFLDRNPAAGAAAGRLVDLGGKPQRGWNVRRFPTLCSLAADLLLVDQVWPSNPATRRFRAEDLDEREPGEVEQPAAACLMLRRSAFEAVGGMDEAFQPAWFEDVDLCRRLRAAGWRIFFVPEAVFVHEGGTAMRRMGREAFTRAWYRNMRKYVRKHHGRGFAASVDGLIAAGMIERFLVSAARRDWNACRTYSRVVGDMGVTYRVKVTGDR